MPPEPSIRTMVYPATVAPSANGMGEEYRRGYRSSVRCEPSPAHEIQISIMPPGVGARYTVHWKIGSVPIGGSVEVVEFDQPRDLSWIVITGVSQRGRFRLRETDDGRTKVDFRLAYESAGNVLRLIADRVAARQVGRNMGQTLKNLKRMVES